jgi:hypothetical protein
MTHLCRWNESLALSFHLHMFNKYSKYQIHSKFKIISFGLACMCTVYQHTIQKDVSELSPKHSYEPFSDFVSSQKIVSKELVLGTNLPMFALYSRTDTGSSFSSPRFVNFFSFPPHDKLKSLSLLFSPHFRMDIKPICFSYHICFLSLLPEHLSYLGATFLTASVLGHAFGPELASYTVHTWCVKPFQQWLHK